MRAVSPSVVLAVALVLVATSGCELGRSVEIRGSAATPTAAPTPPPTPSPSPASPVRDGLATTTRPTIVRVVPSVRGEVISLLRAAIPLPIRGERNGFLRIETPCELDGWVPAADVSLEPRAIGRAASMRDATIVIDPGHGGLDKGAVGPDHLLEKDANLAIAADLRKLLAPARVVMTRTSDYTAGLSYRTDIASAVGADLFVSVHNNSSPDGPSAKPGTETFYQFRSSTSKRLAGLTYEELVRALRRFRVHWVAERDAGAKYRLNERGGDYYHVLRTSTVPAVIVEGLYISNPPEEALLRRADVRQLMAQALATAIDRFVTTDEPGSGFIANPLPRPSGPVYRTPTTCHDPS